MDAAILEAHSIHCNVSKPILCNAINRAKIFFVEHISKKYVYIIELVRNDKIVLIHLLIDEMLGDPFTKAIWRYEIENLKRT